jgi:hypothetical protein
MKLPSQLKNATTVDIALFILFVIYLVFPIQTPVMISPYIDSPIGILLMFCATLYLFFFVNPILGIVFVFVAYELLRRSASYMGIGNSGVRSSLIMQYTPSEEKKEEVLQSLNPPTPATLEEELVAKMAPVGLSETNPIVNSQFAPVAENIRGASFV